MLEVGQYWYFTFGFGQQYQNMFVKIYGTDEGARRKMVKVFGQKWSMQYSELEWRDEYGISQQTRFNLKELQFPE